MGKDNERLKLLLVEDGVQEITSCENAVTRYMEEKHRQVEVVSCKDVGDALRKLDSTFDGAIIDLKLANQGNEGTQVE